MAALSAVRQRLLVVRQQLQQPLQEQQGFISPLLQKQLAKTYQASLKAINLNIDKIEKQIKDLIDKDSHLKELFELITSIPGVGTATASEVIIATKAFFI